MRNGFLGMDPGGREQHDPLPLANRYSTAKPEEGGARGEIWAVIRALLLVVAVVLLLGWLVA
ncbi:MAG: hypothetical protein N3D18_07050 [Roseococcus sp.]|nr:hypothetical protein [Roseococcus sp.]